MLHRRTGTGDTTVPTRQPNGPPPGRPPTSSANAAYSPLKRRESANLYSIPGASPPRTSTYGDHGAHARYAVPSPSPNGAVAGGAFGASGGGGSYMDAKAQRRSSAQFAQLASPPYAGGLYAQAGRGSLDLGERYDAGEDDGPLPARFAKGLKVALVHLKKGLEDSARLDRSWGLVWGDPELRLVVLKSSMINLASLLLLSFAEVVFAPLYRSQTSPSAITRTKEIGLWYNVLFSWPVFIVCFWINASWGPDISKRASTLLHPTYRHQPSPALAPHRPSDSGLAPGTYAPASSKDKDQTAWIVTAVKSVRRILLIADFHLVGAVLSYIPWMGYWVSFAYMCIITGSYCFEWTLTSKGLSLEQRISYIQERTAYMIGFGFLATFVTSFSTTLVNMAIFALIYPFFVIQALLSRPPLPRKSSLLPSTPSPGPSMPASPSPLDSPTLSPFFSTSTPFLSSSSTPFISTSPGTLGSRRSGQTSKPNIAPLLYDLSTGRWEVRVPLFYFAGFAVRALDWFVLAVGRDRVRGLRDRDRDRGKRAF